MPSDQYYETFWKELLSTGPTCLLKQDWQAFEQRVKLDDVSRVVFKHLLERMDSQTKWIVERTAAMRDEGERIVHIGEMVRRSGLRSYTDEKGRTFVAGEKS